MNRFMNDAFQIYDDEADRLVATLYDESTAFAVLAFIQEHSPETVFLMYYDETKIARYKDGAFGYIRN